MKPISKKAAKICIVFICIALVIGTLFAFVPIPFSKGTFTSLAAVINKSTDLSGGVYAEYDLEGKYSAAEINASIGTIRDVLEEKGYANANIFALGDSKIRIEIGYQGKFGILNDPYSLLSVLGVGTFELRSSSSEDDTYVIGSKHLKGVDINTYNGQTFAVLNFNKAGEEAYAKLLKAAQTIYVYMGGQQMTSLEASNITASSSMPLALGSYAAAEDFAMRVKLGSMPVTLNNKTVCINTMSSSLSINNFVSNPNFKLFASSDAFIGGVVVLAVVVILAMAFLIWKSGVFGLLELVALALNTIIAVFFLWAFPWVELSLSSLIAIGFGYIIVLASSFIYISRVREEFALGKTVTASLESGFKKSLSPVIATGTVLTVIFGVIAIFASADLRVFGLITCIFSILSMLNTVVLLPGLVRIFEAFNDGAAKPYRLLAKEENKDEK